MEFKGNGKYKITIKNTEIDDISISDLRMFFNSLDGMLKLELINSFKKDYANGRYSFDDIEKILEEEITYEGNLSTKFVKDIYSQMNFENKISKKQASKIIAKKLKKSEKTIEKHLYKK